MFRTILVPLDGTSFGEQALPAAMAVARRTGAAVRLAHVHRPTTAGEFFFGVPSDLEPLHAARTALGRVAAEMTATGIPTEYALLDGPVAETLERYAGEVKADLVVLATHGRGTVGRAVLGGVADRLVRRLTVPTLLVRPADTAPGHGRPAPARHLLIALDGSPEAEAVLPTAIELGRAMSSRFTLLRVVGTATGFHPQPNGLAIPYPDLEYTQQLRTAAAAYLGRVAEPLRAQGLDVNTRATVHHDPAAAVLEEASILGCDLIAMESHDRAGLARLILGSVTGDVVRNGHTPVLTNTATA